MSPGMEFYGPSGADRRFSVKKYGAIGNGTAYEDAAINRTIIAAQAAGHGGEVEFPPGEYLVQNWIVPLITKNIKFCGYGGAKIKRKYSDIPYSNIIYSGLWPDPTTLQAAHPAATHAGLGFYCDFDHVGHPNTLDRLYYSNGVSWVDAGPWVPMSTAIFWPYGGYYADPTPNKVLTDITKDSSILKVTTTAPMSEGDGLLIASSEFYDAYNSYIKGFMTKVTKVVDADHVQIKDAAPYLFTFAGNTITVKTYQVPPQVTIEGLTFEMVGTANSDPCFDMNCMGFESLFDSSIRNVITVNSSGSGIKTDRIYGCSISDIRARTAKEINGFGYGISCFGNFDTQYYDLDIWASRHPIAMSGIPGVNVRFSDSIFISECYNDGVSWDAHIVESVVVDNCKMPNGIKYSGRNLRFSNSEIGCDGGNVSLNRAIFNRGQCDFQGDVEFIHDKINLTASGTPVVWTKYFYETSQFLLDMGNLRFIDCDFGNIDVTTPYFFGGNWGITKVGEVVIEDCRFSSKIAVLTQIFAGVSQLASITTRGLLRISNNKMQYVTIGTPPIFGGTSPFSSIYITENKPTSGIFDAAHSFCISMTGIKDCLVVCKGNVTTNVIAVNSFTGTSKIFVIDNLVLDSQAQNYGIGVPGNPYVWLHNNTVVNSFGTYGFDIDAITELHTGVNYYLKDQTVTGLYFGTPVLHVSETVLYNLEHVGLKFGAYSKTPITQPALPAVPTPTEISTALHALGLVS